MTLYLWLHAITIAFPLLRSFEPKVAYASRWKALLPAILLVAAFFVAWDISFTKSGVWGFNNNYLTGLYLSLLPIEEWLFFVTVPFASVFIYDCVAYFDKRGKLNKRAQIPTVIAGLMLLVLAFLFQDKAYTFYNFMFAGLMLLLQGLVLRSAYMGRFYVAYLVHLLPFFIVNGILTGGITSEPVVWYNNEENLGIRTWTIPVEDFIYALLLLLMNVTVYEFLKSKMFPKHN